MIEKGRHSGHPYRDTYRRDGFIVGCREGPPAKAGLFISAAVYRKFKFASA